MSVGRSDQEAGCQSVGQTRSLSVSQSVRPGGWVSVGRSDQEAECQSVGQTRRLGVSRSVRPGG